MEHSEKRDSPPGFGRSGLLTGQRESQQSGSSLLPKLRRCPTSKEPSYLARPDNRDMANLLKVIRRAIADESILAFSVRGGRHKCLPHDNIVTFHVGTQEKF